MESSVRGMEDLPTKPQVDGPLEVIRAIRSFDSLSEDARAVLARLEDTDEDLSSISTDELTRLLLECLS